MNRVAVAMLATICGLTGCAVPPSIYEAPPSVTGNWQMLATSTVNGEQTPFAIYLTVTGNSISGALWNQSVYPVAGQCAFPFTDIEGNLTGTMANDGNAILKSSPTTDGSVLTITGQFSSSGTLNHGAYTIAGGCTSDAGTVTANYVAPVNGTYVGTMTSSRTGNIMMVSAAIAQTSAPVSGALRINAAVTFTGSPCLVTALVPAPLTSSSGLLGNSFSMTLTSSTNSSAEISMFGGVSDDAKTLTLNYTQNGGNCSYDTGQGTLTLQ